MPRTRPEPAIVSPLRVTPVRAAGAMMPGVALALTLGLALGAAASGAAAAQMLAAQVGAHADAAQQVAFDVYVPLRHGAALEALLRHLQQPAWPEYHRWLTPAQFAARFGAAPGAMARISAEFRAAGLAASGNGSHSLRVSGSVASVERMLGTRLAIGHFADGHDRLVAVTAPSLPESVVEAGGVVAQFAPVNHVRPHSRTIGEPVPLNRYSPTGPYWFDDLKQAYSFPSVSVAIGAGAHIGILMSGSYNPANISAYFGHEGLNEPAISTVQIDGGAPFEPNGSSVETELDLQQSGGMAPGANITLFNLPDLSDAAIMAGLTVIVESNAVDVVSMSSGAPEIGYSAAYSGVNMTGMLSVFDSLFMQGNAEGISFVASSGDSGALAVPAVRCFAPGATAACGGFVRSVEMPADSPHVTAVGGTNLVTTHTRNPATLASAYVSEAANYDPLALDIFYGTPATGGVWGSGGGVSAVFAQPSYQLGVSTTSALWRMAAAGYNPVPGNGTLFANVFLGVSNLPVAGVPQTASNP